MSGFVLTPRLPFETRVDLSGVGPASEGDLGAIKLACGSRRIALGDVFDVSGSAGERLTIQGGSAWLDGVGAGLAAGEIVVRGDVGARLGAGMTGGAIAVEGSAGAYAASELKGGRIAVSGDVGERLGAAGDGARRGMCGGVVLVGGSAGVRAGERLRGGLIVISGDAGDGAATDLIAGTLAIGGRLGAQAGRGMKRGTLFLRSADGLSAGFSDAGVHDFVAIRVLARRSPELAAFLGADAAVARRFAGDLYAGGQGEALIVSR